jgi:hypothetical protein
LPEAAAPKEYGTSDVLPEAVAPKGYGSEPAPAAVAPEEEDCEEEPAGVVPTPAPLPLATEGPMYGAQDTLSILSSAKTHGVGITLLAALFFLA